MPNSYSIEPGLLRHSITQRTDISDSQNSVGQSIPTYTTNGPFYALVESLGGGESTNADQYKGTSNYRITMRAKATTWKPTDLIIWNDHTLNIKSINIEPFGAIAVIEASELIATQ